MTQKTLAAFVHKIAFDCPSCKQALTFKLDLSTMKHEIREVPASTFGEKMRLITHFKRLKGYDKLPNWDQQYRGRAMSAATKILKFFAMLDDKVGIAIECLNDIHRIAEKDGWDWTLETVAKRAPDWLIRKQGGVRK